MPVVRVYLKTVELGGRKPVYTAETHANRPKSKKRRKALIWTGATAVAAVVALIIILHILNAPAQGTIINNPAQAVQAAQAATPGSYSDSYISFQYPASFTPVASPKQTGYLSSITMLSDDHPTIHASIGLVTEQLQNDSGLHYRQLHPDIYKTISSTDTTAVFSSDQNGSEYTGFIAHNGEVLDISLTSVRPSLLPVDYDFIAKSLVWKQ